MALSAVLIAPSMAHATQSAAPNTSKMISAKQVSKHGSPSDCWSSVNGKVYDFTAWISKHPGGSSDIKKMCGRNASKDFNSEHRGDRDAMRALAPFQIGTLKKVR